MSLYSRASLQAESTLKAVGKKNTINNSNLHWCYTVDHINYMLCITILLNMDENP